jgi:hypothetical protein
LVEDGLFGLVKNFDVAPQKFVQNEFQQGFDTLEVSAELLLGGCAQRLWQRDLSAESG